MAQKKIVQTAGRTQLGEFAPEFARLNDDILFGEVWSRNDLLSLRDRRYFGGNIETNNENERYVVDICDPFCRICSFYIHTCKDWN